VLGDRDWGCRPCGKAEECRRFGPAGATASRPSWSPVSTASSAPTIERRVDVLRFDALIEWFEQRNGVCDVALAVRIETARALSNVEQIATEPTGRGRCSPVVLPAGTP
jgi:hypothetical protein